MAFRGKEEEEIDPISSNSNETGDDDDEDDGDYKWEIEGQVDEEGDGSSKSQMSDEDRKSQNVDALVRLEIHENMNCTRCQRTAQMFENDDNMCEVSNGRDSTMGGSLCSEKAEDIGGFAELAGCLHKLKSSEKQIGTPLEEDLGSWGHHFVPTTIPDAILQASAGDEVTFVFTNQIDGKLVPVESAVRSTNQQLATESGHIKEERKVPSSLLLSKNSPESSQNFTRIIPTFNKRSTKLLRTSPNGIHVQRKMNMLSNNHSTPKQTHAITDKTDDDFV